MSIIICLLVVLFISMLLRAIAEAVRGVKPRLRPQKMFTDTLILSGLEVMSINKFSNFINIGEKCNVAGSRRFCKLITQGKYEVRI